MKTTGIIRRMDGLGRVVIPAEYRRSMKIEENDPLSISAKGGTILVTPLKLQCVYCGSTDEDQLEEFQGLHHCRKCLTAIRRG